MAKPDTRKINTAVSWAIIVALALSSGLLYRKRENDIVKHDRLTTSFIERHKCVRDGFAGRDAIPILKCDNGLFLEPEIWKKNLQ